MTSLSRKNKYGEVILEAENTFRIFCDLCTDTFLTLENFRYHIFKHLTSQSSEDSTDSFLDFVFKDVDSSDSGENLEIIPNPIRDIEINPLKEIEVVTSYIQEQLNINDENYKLNDFESIDNMLNSSIDENEENTNDGCDFLQTDSLNNEYDNLENIEEILITDDCINDDTDTKNELVKHFDNSKQKIRYDFDVIRCKLKDIFTLYDGYCPICFHTYINVSGLIRHTKNHLRDHTKEQIIHIYKTSQYKTEGLRKKSAIFKCTRCKQSYAHNNDLQRHIRLVHMQKLKCSYCGRPYMHPSDLQRHVKLIHLKKFTCKFCVKIFDTTHMFARHMLDKHGIEKPFECDQCSQTFKKCSLLTCHLRFHNKEKRFKCEYCGKRFMQNSERKLHIRTYHTNERLYQCDECGRTFNATSAFKLHKLRHTNKREYKCTKCDKKFYHQSGLRNHFTTHTKEKKYQCNICDAKFGMQGALWTHKRLHSNERKYKCKFCEKSFAQSAGLYSHMKTHCRKEKEK